MGDQVLFGAGNLYLNKIRVGALQEVSFDMSFEQKELYGNKQFPIFVCRGKGKITGKAKSGTFKGGLIQSLLSGSTVTTGVTRLDQHDATIPSSVAYTVTVDHAADFVEDLGVLDENMNPMAQVDTVAAAGEYSVNTGTGVYTFYSADAGKAVHISYTYTDDTGGKTIKYSNQLMGTQVVYSLGLYNAEPDGTFFGLKYKCVVVPKLGMAFKNDDFTMPDLDLAAFAATDETILEAYVPTV